MGRVGTEAGARREEEPAVDAVLQEASEPPVVEAIGDVHEEKGAALGRVDTEAQTIEILYDADTDPDPLLSDPDNVYASSVGDVYVAEDPGDLQIVALTPTGGVVPVVRLPTATHTEITGPALDPSGTRLYFSSQRNPGLTFEVTGPFAPIPKVPGMSGLARALLAAVPRIDSREVVKSIPGVPPDGTRPQPGCAFAPRCADRKTECTAHVPALWAAGTGHRVACPLAPDVVPPDGLAADGLPVVKEDSAG